jgi:hypothetical protein
MMSDDAAFRGWSFQRIVMSDNEMVMPDKDDIKR